MAPKYSYVFLPIIFKACLSNAADFRQWVEEQLEKKISGFWQLAYRANTFGMNVCNCLYEDPNNPDLPTSMRFFFNHIPHIVTSENNFFVSFLYMENSYKPAVFATREYLIQTEVAIASKDNAERVLDIRLELLNTIRKAVGKVIKVFTMYMKDQMVSVKYWADHILAIPAWNINGISGGASGGESLTFHSLDEFLGTHGEGVIYKGGMGKRQGFPSQYNLILDMLNKHGTEYRFKSFLGHAESDDPVLKAKDDIINALYIWRLGHAKIAPQYLANSRMTFGGSLDRVIETGETLALRGDRELKERARETVIHMKTRPIPKSALV